MPKTALIIGAGIGGLATAIALARVGVKVDIYERAHELKEVGAGIILYPNAVNVLRQLQVYDAIAKEGNATRVGRYLNSEGKLLVELDFVRAGIHEEAVAIHRADLQRVLAEKVGMDNIHFGAPCTDIKQSSVVSAVISDNSSVDADMLIGADGIHSIVRNKILRDGAPRYANCFAWRGVTKLVHNGIPPESGMLVFGKGLQFGATHIGKGRIYWFGAVASTEGHKGRTAKKDALDIFKSWTDPVTQLIESTPEDEILTHDLYDRDPSSIWGQNRITLLGDAAHPMTPFMGQGGCQALEDSIALAASIKGEADISRALRHYEQLRLKRTTNFVLQSRKAQTASMTSSSALCLMRDLILPIVPKAILIKEFHTLAGYEIPNLD